MKKYLLEWMSRPMGLFLGLIFVSMSNLVYAQNLSVSGTVRDADGLLSGVSVGVKGAAGGTSTDTNGRYSVTLPSLGATLVFSMVGYSTQEIQLKGQQTLDVLLESTQGALDEVVVVGYGTQKRQSLTGSVATVRNEDITVAPIASTTNALAGRLPGLVSLQSNGRPGADAASLSIRGFGNALVIVDGFEADFNTIDPQSIESISILKDASASIYGSRAGNGVILVTTKRGKDEPARFNFNTAYTLQGNTLMPKPVSSGQFAELRAEEWLQRGDPVDQVPFTPEQIQKYYEGNDPLFPNTNWYDELIRPWAPQHNHNLSVRGGSGKVNYYGFLGYLDQATIWRNNGGDYNRYNLQSNVDIKVQENFTIQVDIASIVEDRKFPWRPQDVGGSVWENFWNTFPIYPAEFPDKTKVPYTFGNVNALANSEISGYSNTFSQNLKGTLSLNYQFKTVPGLSIKAFGNYLQNYGSHKQFNKPVKFYTYEPNSDEYILAGALGEKASLNARKDQSRILTGQFSANFERTFYEDHKLSVLALHELISYSNDYLTGGRVNFLTPAIDQLFAGSTSGMSNGGAASEMGRKSFVGRVNYDFQQKYLFEGTLRADASAKFPANKRWGYFPSVSLGWRLSEEQFLNGVKWLDEMKLRMSYGESGNDGVGNFQYLSGYGYGQTYVLGNGAQQGLVSTGLANPNLTWEQIKIYNAGIEASFWNRKLYSQLDVFYRLREGIPATRLTSLPSSFGANLPPENLNSLNDRGFDLMVGSAGNYADLNWNISGNISWTRAKWDHFEEPGYADPEQIAIYQVSGRWVDRQFGYAADGLFMSQEEINNLSFDQDQQGNTTLRPGDVKYQDINGDGVLNWKDQVEIGMGTVPRWMFGLNTSLKYRDFDLSALFQGALGFYSNVTLQHGQVSPTILYELRWTSETNDTNALVPRLGGAATNGFLSDYRYKRADYLRLKVVSLGYTVPVRYSSSLGIQQLRVFFSGTNLLTFSPIMKYDIDPESPSGNAGKYYPQQKTMSFGAVLTF